MRMIRLIQKTTIMTMVALLLAGCATHQMIKDEIAASEQKQNRTIDQLRQQMTAELELINDAALQDTQKAKKDSAMALLQAQNATQTIEELQKAFSLRNDLLEKQRAVVYFGFDRDDLNDAARTILNSVATLVGKDKNNVVFLEGHTDEVGRDSYNNALSKRRVDRVIRYLVGEKGSALNQLHLIGMGERYPVTDNNSAEGRQQNRRVIIRVLAPR